MKISKSTLPLTAAGMAAIVALVAASTGCTAGGANDGPPGGYISMIAQIIGSNGVNDSAGVVGEFFSDFPSSDPLDDPGANPYADLGEGQCEGALVQGTAASAAATHLDVGSPVTLTQTGGGSTYNMTPSGTPPFYFASIDPATFPYNQLFDVSMPGSGEIGPQDFPQGLASSDSVTVTAPAGFNGGDTTFPNGDLTLTYGAVQSEMLLVAFVDDQGNGQICRMPLGTGASNDFVVPAATIGLIPATGTMVVTTYDHRTEQMNGRTLDLIGRTDKLAFYTRN